MMALPFSGGSAIGLSATDAWRRAAVGDGRQRDTANGVPGMAGGTAGAATDMAAAVGGGEPLGAAQQRAVAPVQAHHGCLLSHVRAGSAMMRPCLPSPTMRPWPG